MGDGSTRPSGIANLDGDVGVGLGVVGQRGTQHLAECVEDRARIGAQSEDLWSDSHGNDSR